MTNIFNVTVAHLFTPGWFFDQLKFNTCVRNFETNQKFSLLRLLFRVQPIKNLYYSLYTNHYNCNTAVYEGCMLQRVPFDSQVIRIQISNH